MKIYEIRWHTGEKSWVCANTTIEAIKVYCKQRNTNFDEFDGMDDIILLPKLKWSFYKVKDAQSFSQYMRNAVVPDVIAETFLNTIIPFKQEHPKKLILKQLFNNKSSEIFYLESPTF